MTTAKPAILLIDDNREVLEGLAGALSGHLPQAEVDINTWRPEEADISDDVDAEAVFKARCDGRTSLVITDYDLSTGGLRGLFGPSIVAWSQAAAIPVGDFSRGQKNSLPKEPNLFELRVPPNDLEGSLYIANVFRGFRALRQALQADMDALHGSRSMAAALANALGRPLVESQFALYMARLGSANSSLIDRLRKLGADDPPDVNELADLTTYLMGHVLANSVMRFPGPILSAKALCAYCATSVDEADALAPFFAEARYEGPFSGFGPYYWREDVDRRLDIGAEALPADIQVGDSVAQYNRAVVEAWLKRPLANHDCERCDGVRGGFWCPFTHRPVCDLGECSVPSSAWVPQGATLTRVERDFYDELAPLLGL